MLIAPFSRTAMLAIIFAGVSLTGASGHAGPPAQQATATSAMPGMDASGTPHGCDDLSSMGGMSVMGESMGAMKNHMCITPLRARQPPMPSSPNTLRIQVPMAMAVIASTQPTSARATSTTGRS